MADMTMKAILFYIIFMMMITEVNGLAAKSGDWWHYQYEVSQTLLGYAAFTAILVYFVLRVIFLVHHSIREIRYKMPETPTELAGYDGFFTRSIVQLCKCIIPKADPKNNEQNTAETAGLPSGQDVPPKNETTQTQESIPLQNIGQKEGGSSKEPTTETEPSLEERLKDVTDREAKVEDREEKLKDLKEKLKVQETNIVRERSELQHQKFMVKKREDDVKAREEKVISQNTRVSEREEEFAQRFSELLRRENQLEAREIGFESREARVTNMHEAFANYMRSQPGEKGKKTGETAQAAKTAPEDSTESNIVKTSSDDDLYNHPDEKVVVDAGDQPGEKVLPQAKTDEAGERTFVKPVEDLFSKEVPSSSRQAVSTAIPVHGASLGFRSRRYVSGTDPVMGDDVNRAPLERPPKSEELEQPKKVYDS